MTPNWLATFVLAAWPFVALILFSKQKIADAVIWTLLGGFLVLPESATIKFAMVPSLDKNSIPNLCVFIGCLFATPHLPRLSNKFGIVEVLLLFYTIGPVVTSELNNDPILTGDIILPGVDSYDGISTLISQLIFIIPFFLGRRYFRSASNNEAILRALAVGGLAYSIPMLFEIRMSPQLSSWIYGYFPSSMQTEMRYGGFRPVVFLGNGLILAFFIVTSALAAATFSKARLRLAQLPSEAVAVYLGVLVVLCKAAGALIYGVFLGMLVRFTKPKLQVKIALALGLLGLFYPTLRITELFPNDALVALAAQVDQQRAESLTFRFNQEDHLLEHATERFFFGWGRFGRNRVHADDSGRDESVTDGRWIIVMGQFGFLGFLAEFGLLTIPIFRTFLSFRFATTLREQIFLASLSLIVAISVVDLLPNSSLTPWTWLLAGTLLGRSEALRANSGRLSPRDVK
jgi:hypothetical protein